MQPFFPASQGPLPLSLEEQGEGRGGTEAGRSQGFYECMNIARVVCFLCFCQCLCVSGRDGKKGGRLKGTSSKERMSGMHVIKRQVMMPSTNSN